MALRQAEAALAAFFGAHPKVALGFSGGVDSAYLLYAGLRSGADIRPYFIKTAFQPRFELEDALRLAKQLGAALQVIEVDLLSLPAVVSNPPDRCYFCKTALFGALRKRALADGYALVIDGTNASDDALGRPGMRALAELSVRSPLRECGLTKDEIRLLSKEAGLFTWNKPAYACLATRIPAGNAVTPDLLLRVEGAEDALFQMGFLDFRVRVLAGAARLQFRQEDIARAFNERESIRLAIKPFFHDVLLDLTER